MIKVTDETIRAWVDGELSADRNRELEGLIANDPEIAAKAASFEASKLPYKAAMDSDIPPVPVELQDNVEQWIQIARGASATDSSDEKNLRFWSGAVVAVLLLSVISWGGINFLKPDNPVENWREAIVSYQSFYVAGTVSDIVGDPVVASSKLSKLKQLSMVFPDLPPDLSSQGYAYKRLQQLDFANQPVLQMVFYKAGKRPLAICLMPDDTTNTQAQFTQHDLLNSYVWQSGKLRGIVVAEESSEVLKGIAGLVDI